MLSPVMNPTHKLTVALALACLGLSACARRPPEPSADARLQGIYTREWQWRMGQLPDDEDS